MNKKFDSKQSKWKKALSLFDKVVKKHAAGSGKFRASLMK